MDLVAMRDALAKLNDDELADLGLRRTRKDDMRWVPLADAFCVALRRLGRYRAAKALEQSMKDGMVNQYSIGLNARLLREVVNVLTEVDKSNGH